MASLLGESGKPIFRAFFSNTTEGADSLLAKLEEHNVSLDDLESGWNQPVIILLPIVKTKKQKK